MAGSAGSGTADSADAMAVCALVVGRADLAVGNGRRAGAASGTVGAGAARSGRTGARTHDAIRGAQVGAAGVRGCGRAVARAIADRSRRDLTGRTRCGGTFRCSARIGAIRGAGASALRLALSGPAARRARADGIALDRLASTDRPGFFARLALAATFAVAADPVDAVSRRALRAHGAARAVVQSLGAGPRRIAVRAGRARGRGAAS